MNATFSTLSVVETTQALGLQAKAASALMARAQAATKNIALRKLAALLRENTPALQVENAKDIERAVAAGLAAPMVDRLKLTPKVLETCAQGCEQLASMADVIGEIIGMKQQPSGIRVGQMRVPIGVFGMIFESRPNVTIEAASLSIKSGNACILRGGSEAIDSNKALAKLVQQALLESGLPEDAVQLVQTTDREVVGQLITMPQYVDVIIPRGGKGLIERISAEAKVPVIKHLDGNCHVYVDVDADLVKAGRIADNAKTQRYGTCNTMETLLTHHTVAAEFLPVIEDLRGLLNAGHGRNRPALRYDAGTVLIDATVPLAAAVGGRDRRCGRVGGAESQAVPRQGQCGRGRGRVSDPRRCR